MVSFASVDSDSEALPAGTRSLSSNPNLGVTCLSFVLVVYSYLTRSSRVHAAFGKA